MLSKFFTTHKRKLTGALLGFALIGFFAPINFAFADFANNDGDTYSEVNVSTVDAQVPKS